MFSKNITNLEQVKSILQLYTVCPYCKNYLTFRQNKNNPYITIDQDDDYDFFCQGYDYACATEYQPSQNIRTTIEFKADGLNVIIDLDTGRVNFSHNFESAVPVFSGTTLQYFGSVKECMDCKNFSYNIQHVLKISNNDIDVSSSLKEINIVYDKYLISYCYDRQKTLLDIFERDTGDENAGIQHTLEVPLLELNIKNPVDVIDRIKKLHLFT